MCIIPAKERIELKEMLLRRLMYQAVTFSFLVDGDQTCAC